ncbi:ribonuclease H-like domain-containing protein [Tanacetum coccineum]|uniref:Ribonuclease H-like domain-containing protein n=1 Tax=Tanacetum coccineum TaxID=301880 RepID=A0ABQ5HKN6_9ASTR
MIDIWKVIQNGNSLKRTGRDHDGRVILLPTTADEHIAVQRESKARTTLLQSIPDDHVADFHYMDDARDIWNAVKARFGGNAESKKMRKSMLKQEFSEFRISESEGLHKGYDRMQKILSQLNQLKAKPDDEDINLKFLRGLPSSWSQVALTLKTKGGLELLSFDDLYYKLKTLEIDIKGYSTHSSSQSPSHSAFVSTTSTSKKMSYAESPSFSSSTTYSAPSSSKARSHSSGNTKLDLEEMDIKWQMAMLSFRVNKFEKKAGRKIEFDKKEAARAKGGNEKRYSSFKIQELWKKEADTKALIIVDTLENWKEHESRNGEGFAPKEYGMVAGYGVACKEGVAEVYSLITRNGTDAAVREFALMGMTSELGWDDSTFSVFTTNSEEVKVDLFSIVTSLRGNTKTLDASDSSVKSSEPKSNDSNTCASTSSVSTSESEAEIESNVGTPIQEPIIVWQDFFIPTARPNQVPAGRPKSVSTGRPKPVSTGAPVSTGKQNRPPPVHAGRRNSSFSYFCMTGNKEILDDFQPFKGGKVTFGGGEGRITRKGTIRTPKVLFTDTDCLVLSNYFKLLDESMVLLRVPRKHNLYTFNLNNLAPKENLACLVAKASSDEAVKWHRRMGHLNKKVKAIRCDNGTEFKNAKLIELCGEKGIKRDYSNARTPQQNGVAERKNRTLIEAARTMLADSKLPTMFWTEAADEGYLVGYSASNRAYKVYNMANKRVEETMNLSDEQVILVPSYPSNNIPGAEAKDTYDAHSNGVLVDTAEDIFQQESSRAEKVQEQREPPLMRILPSGDTIVFVLLSPSDVFQFQTLGGVFQFLSGPSDLEIMVPSTNVDKLWNFPPSTLHPNDDEFWVLIPKQFSINCERSTKKQSHRLSAFVWFAFFVFSQEVKPKSVAQALEDPSWVDAMQAEMQKFKFQNVWILVDLPC